MKNKYIIDSFKVINPSTEDKSLMLDRVLKKKDKKNTPFINLLPIFLSIIVVILINNSNEIKFGNYKTLALRENNLEFIYKNKCYQESNILSNTDNLKMIGRLTNIENSTLKNVPIYQDESNNVILNLNGYYITFVKTNCFKNKKG